MRNIKTSPNPNPEPAITEASLQVRPTDEGVLLESRGSCLLELRCEFPAEAKPNHLISIQANCTAT